VPAGVSRAGNEELQVALLIGKAGERLIMHAVRKPYVCNRVEAAIESHVGRV